MGHRIIEIGAVEMINRKLTGNHYHVYINPERDIDDGALEVHGITAEFLADKPVFHDVINDFLEYIRGAELVIHNAPFDVSFLDYELKLAKRSERVAELSSVVDSLVLARRKHPGQKNNLDALCRRYQVDNSQRTLHGALLDAEILADVYLLMTGGQTQLFGAEVRSGQADEKAYEAIDTTGLVVVEANVEEQAAHEAYLDFLETKGAPPVWRANA